MMLFIPKFERIVDGYFLFGAHVHATAHQCLNNESIKSFWYGFSCHASELTTDISDELIFRIGQAEKPTLNGNQYAVNVEKTGLCIIADSEKGLINGFITLLYQIEVLEITDEKSVFRIKCGLFREKPKFKNLMVHFCVFPETELWEIEKFLRYCAAVKYSHVVLEFWGMLRYDCLKELAWDFAFTKEEIRPLIRMANELGLQIVPMFNHFGHASASRAMHGKHVVLDQNPKLQPLFSEDGWSWNIEKTEVQRLLRDIRKELIELCGSGDYFHIGCDEVYNFEITDENYVMWTEYLNGLCEELTATGRRPIVWGDMLVAKRKSFNPKNNYTASCKSVELEQLLLSNLNKNIVFADWQYNVKEAPVETALVFRNAGFDTLLSPWDSVFDGGDSVTPCVNTAINSELHGVMHTTWHTLSKGMPDVTKVAFEAWNSLSEEKLPRSAFFATATATILRKVCAVGGDYRKAGWAKEQISTIT